VLATWPDLFHAIERGVHRDPANCTAVSGTSEPELQAFCFAHAYANRSGSTVPRTLAATFEYAAVAFDAQLTQLASWLRSQYGVFPAFSRLGFSAEGFVLAGHKTDELGATAGQVGIAGVCTPECEFEGSWLQLYFRGSLSWESMSVGNSCLHRLSLSSPRWMSV
jgi:hypothetical protein